MRRQQWKKQRQSVPNDSDNMVDANGSRFAICADFKQTENGPPSRKLTTKFCGSM